MPGVAFTKEGLRLGHGKGFYDKFLCGHKERFGHFPKTTALALKAQMVESLPTHEYDVPVDCVIHS